MNYGELKTQFEGLLKRRDLTTTQRDTWLQQAISRIQRKLRVPAMERPGSYTTDSSGAISIPDDLVQLKAITVDATPTDLSARTLQEVLQTRKDLVGYPPTMYCRRDGNYLLAPFPAVGTVVTVDYYAELNALTLDTDTNWLTDIAPDVIVYGALSLACDWFIDKRGATFEQRFVQFAQELQDQGDLDELNNARMAPAHTYPEDC
jgi:hypothetical protein